MNQINNNPKDWLCENDPVPFMLRVAETLHVGDEELIVAHFASAHSLGLGPKVDPIHLYTTGRSSSGKGHCAGAVLKLFPKDNSVSLSSFSPKGFHYASATEKLDGKIFHFPEVTIVGQDEEKLGLLRILSDSSSESKRGEHWTVDDKRKSLKLKVEGRFVIWINSVTPISDEEIKNRFLIGGSNESREQDCQVQRRQMEKLGLLAEIENDDEIRLCREINQIILEETIADVFIPHAPYILFPNTKNRRLYPMFVNVVKAIAKIRYAQRKRIQLNRGENVVDVLIATPDDLLVAMWVFNRLLSTTISQVSSGALSMLDAISITESDAISKLGLSDKLGDTPDTCYRRCVELEKAGYIQRTMRSGERMLYFWKPLFRQTPLKSEIRVEWEKIDEKRLLEAFQRVSVKESDRIIIEDYCHENAGRRFENPSWINEIELRNKHYLDISNSEFQENPRALEMTDRT